MIRAVAEDRDGRTVILLGLEQDNLRRMLTGDVLAGTDEPIRVNLRHFDPDGPPTEHLPDIDIVVFSASPGAVAKLLAMDGSKDRRQRRPGDQGDAV